MRIEKIELFHIKIPLSFNFKTSQTSISYRETIVIKVEDELSNVGYGEVVSFNEPFYTGETLIVSKQTLVNEYSKVIIHKSMDHPFDIHKYFDMAHPMALAGLENALVDLYARRNKKSIMKLLFNEETNKEINAGIVLGDLDIKELLKQIEDYKKEGYIRFKIKIKPKDGFLKLMTIRKNYPDLQLLADANRSYTFDQTKELKKFDGLNLLCLEEPLISMNLLAYQKLQNQLRTPICLDESIQSVSDLKIAIKFKVLDVLNIKVGRVGGLYYAKQMINLCRENNIKYWIGSMLESGVSKILHVHLASLRDTYIAGDLSSSKRYFKEDIINPEIKADNGKINVPKGYGLGVEIDEITLNKYTIDYIKIGGE